jgi:exodeoxyribonuclease-3
MTWNILFGGEERFPSICERIKALRPDVLALQECLGWDDGVRLNEIAKALELPNEPDHVQLGQARPRGSGKRYHVALLSRFPLGQVQVFNPPAFIGHALLRAELSLVDGPLTLFVAHFDSTHENLRFVEARYLRSVIDAESFAKGRYLLMGDLNSLSSRDPYPGDLAEQVARAKVDKYGHPPRFEVTAELESFGWIDSLRAKPFEGSWITAHRERGGVPIDYRIDYVFASPLMAERLIEARVEDARGASDHQPMLASFDVTPS